MKNISRSLFLFGVILFISGLVIGVVDREWSRFFFKNIYLDRQIVVGFNLFLTHGHILIFSLFSFVLAILLKTETNPTQNTVVFFWVYVIGTTLTLALGIYKGLFLSALVGMDPRMGLFHADAFLFGGNRILRSLIYSIAHTLMATRSIALVIKAFKGWKPSN
jgi:hypothetical protein